MRDYTDKIRDMLDQGLITGEAVAEMALHYFSEDDIKDMCRANDILLDDELDEDEDDDEDKDQYLVFGDRGQDSQTLLYETTLYSEAVDWILSYTERGLAGYDCVEMGYYQRNGNWMPCVHRNCVLK